jgi:hypothetical protein
VPNCELNGIAGCVTHCTFLNFIQQSENKNGTKPPAQQYQKGKNYFKNYHQQTRVIICYA